MPPAYVKPYVKRQKNDMADAEAICEAVARANMRFVPTKPPEQQSCVMLHRTRHLFIRQDGGGRAGFTLVLLAALHVKRVMDAIERAVPAPQIEIVEQR